MRKWIISRYTIKYSLNGLWLLFMGLMQDFRLLNFLELEQSSTSPTKGIQIFQKTPK